MKRYNELFKENIILTDGNIQLLYKWLIGSLHKSLSTHLIENLFLKIQKEYPITESKKLYRAIRIPEIDNKEKDIINTRVAKEEIHLTSWTEDFKIAMQIFNDSKFYDKIKEYNSVVLSSKINFENILCNYKTIQNIINDNKNHQEINKLIPIFSRYKKEKEWIVYNKHQIFNCTIEHII